MKQKTMICSPSHYVWIQIQTIISVFQLHVYKSGKTLIINIYDIQTSYRCVVHQNALAFYHAHTHKHKHTKTQVCTHVYTQRGGQFTRTACQFSSSIWYHKVISFCWQHQASVSRLDNKSYNQDNTNMFHIYRTLPNLVFPQ